MSYSIKTFLTKRKKTHYQCGKIEAPYFKEGKLCAPITDGYRWHKIDKNRWICHHCDAHGFSKDYDYYYENFVKEENE